MREQHELMTLAELCDELGISESTAYYWRQIGKGPRGARIGKNLRYRRSDVNAWLDEQFARA
ncbi:DNA-binding protein [Mycobacteroides abscessus]|uniref:helix-turn-helix transcriptional regulator n=1 Tax=Mycobacteroides abscessus TaxID=36809 RepID=UPI000C268055|nr:helix-turn-helix domain-containing protein [Mycobacteroides abscessus]AWG51490.1 DNA-binding protein [Mycobacteroides abscessus]